MPAAVDLAVTSGLTESGLTDAAVDPTAPARLYEAHKRRHGGTAAQCRAAGIAFVPFVLEAEGGLGPSALHVLSRLADDAGRLEGVERNERAGLAKQRLSVTLQHHNATMLLARAPRPREHTAPAALDAAAWAAASASPAPAPPAPARDPRRPPPPAAACP